MRLRTVLLPLAALAGVATAALPSLASGTTPPSSASFTAVDFAWDVSGSSSTQATIAQGGTVDFSYPSGSSQHNADFGTGPQPSSCTQTAGPSSGAVPPLPHSPTAPGWSGTCTFNTPGTYTFHCDLHPFMSATIVVQGSGTTGTTTTTTPPTTTTAPPTTTTTPPTTTATTTATTTPGTTTTPTSTTTTSPAGTTTITTPPPTTSGPAPASPLAPHGVAIARTQRGSAVRGSVRVAAAGAGGRLEVDLLIGTRRRVRVGRLVRRDLRAGLARFAVRLKPAAAAALRLHKRLELTVRVILTGTNGVRVVVTRKVVLKL